jgi:polyhydroxyalkanoate synthesis regulator phasin
MQPPLPLSIHIGNISQTSEYFIQIIDSLIPQGLINQEKAINL